MGIWNVVFDWLGIFTIILADIVQLYQQMGFYKKGAKVKRMKFLFWHVTSWSLWNARNSIIFRDGTLDAASIIARIKMLSWQWLLGKKGNRPGLFFSSWCINPSGCF
ncbi:hypothetical protein HKD37_01G000537 [Glycine soja]